MSDTKLKPCPICNKEVTVALGGDRKTYFFFMTRGIGKNGCKCRLFFESEPFGKDTSEEDKERIKNDLINAWNTRKPIDRIVEQLEIANEDYCRTKHFFENDCEHKDCFKCCAEHLIKIVKAGGIDG